VIGDHVKHHPDAFFVSSIDHILESLLITKVRVDLVSIESAITMIVVSVILWDRRDPDGIESHSFDVVKLVLNALKGAATILVNFITRLCVAIVSPETIGQKLIYGS
jgi:hypothetical protein